MIYPPVNATGIVQSYTLILARQCLPGHNREQITINGSTPGPSLYVALGNILEVKVVNEIYDDVAEIHFHGQNFRNRPWMDGLVNLTQCPISNVPGNNTFFYRFAPEVAGTYWYHGHMHGQLPDGLYGALVVTDSVRELEALAAHNVTYEEDSPSWIFQVADYYATEVRYLEYAFLQPGTFANDPVPDAIIVNNAFSEGFVVNVQNRSSKVRLRLINAAAYSPFVFSIDGLPLLLIELDGSPVEPKWMASIKLFTAQRASVIIDWSQLNSSLMGKSSLWMRFELLPYIYPSYTRGQPNYGMVGSTTKEFLNFNWKAIINLSPGTALRKPDYGQPPILTAAVAEDVNLLTVQPLYSYPVPVADHRIEMITQFYLDDDNVVRGYINEETFGSNPDYTPFAPAKPLLFSLLDAGDNPYTVRSYYNSSLKQTVLKGDGAHPFVVPYGAVVDVYIDGKCCGAHPFHLHGHHFWILATDEVPHPKTRPLIRDVVTVPFGGWALVRFVADNPGMWLFHCHLHWHASIGLNALIIEAPNELRARYAQGSLVIDQNSIDTCSASIAMVRTSGSTSCPGYLPSALPSSLPSFMPTNMPSIIPTVQPSRKPTVTPTLQPSATPSTAPISAPSTSPHFRPSSKPTIHSSSPVESPTTAPSYFDGRAGVITLLYTIQIAPADSIFLPSAFIQSKFLQAIRNAQPKLIYSQFTFLGPDTSYKRSLTEQYGVMTVYISSTSLFQDYDSFYPTPQLLWNACVGDLNEAVVSYSLENDLKRVLNQPDLSLLKATVALEDIAASDTPHPNGPKASFGVVQKETLPIPALPFILSTMLVVIIVFIVTHCGLWRNYQTSIRQHLRSFSTFHSWGRSQNEVLPSRKATYVRGMVSAVKE